MTLFRSPSFTVTIQFHRCRIISTTLWTNCTPNSPGTNLEAIWRASRAQARGGRRAYGDWGWGAENNHGWEATYIDLEEIDADVEDQVAGERVDIGRGAGVAPVDRIAVPKHVCARPARQPSEERGRAGGEWGGVDCVVEVCARWVRGLGRIGLARATMQ